MVCCYLMFGGCLWLVLWRFVCVSFVDLGGFAVYMGLCVLLVLFVFKVCCLFVCLVWLVCVGLFDCGWFWWFWFVFGCLG